MFVKLWIKRLYWVTQAENQIKSPRGNVCRIANYYRIKNIENYEEEFCFGDTCGGEFCGKRLFLCANARYYGNALGD